MSLIKELSRRNVFRVGAAYAVTAWLLIQVAETIFPLFGFDETPARIVVVVLAIGFVPALVFAWAFEITPEGLKREEDVDRSRSVTIQTGRKLDRVIALVLALALGYFAFDKFVLDPARDAALVEETAQQARSQALVGSYGERSIAVLPFANLSDDPEQNYFSDGMAEELINLLAQVPRLRVISRSSSFAFRDQRMQVPEIAQQLGVNHVLEGSVRKQGDRIRITAQLIEARSDTQLWSQTFERRLDDVFAIQDEISAAIFAGLGSKLALDTAHTALARAPANTEAYEAYLRGRYLTAQRSPAALSGAIDEFEKALALDPDYALAHASMAIALSLRGNSGDQTPQQDAERARRHAERAHELDPNLAESHAALGWVNWGPNSLPEAEAHFRKAIEINPGYAEAHMWLGHFADMRNNYVESFDLYKKAAQLDPLSIQAQNNLYRAFMERGRMDEAASMLDKMASLNPDGRLDWLSYHRAIGGRWADGALASLDLIKSGNSYGFADLQVRLALMGLEQEALADPATLGVDSEVAAELQSNATNVLSLLGRPADAVRAWEALPGGIPQEPGPGYLQSGVLIAATGDYARAGPILERVWPVFQRSAGIAGASRDANFILALMATRQVRQDEAGVTELQGALRDAVRRYEAAGFVHCDPLEGCAYFDGGIAAYLAGDREEGMALIAKAVESGYFIAPNKAFLQFLYDDPGFAPVRERQRALQARQRDRFLAVVCSDNPYADVWRPAEETCGDLRDSRTTMRSQ